MLIRSGVSVGGITGGSSGEGRVSSSSNFEIHFPSVELVCLVCQHLSSFVHNLLFIFTTCNRSFPCNVIQFFQISLSCGFFVLCSLYPNVECAHPGNSHDTNGRSISDSRPRSYDVIVEAFLCAQFNVHTNVLDHAPSEIMLQTTG